MIKRPRKSKSTTLRYVQVLQVPGRRHHGRVKAGPVTFACALGRSGIVRAKREGDGATPAGRFGLGRAYFRADNVARPRSRLDFRVLQRSDAWCDDPTDRRYNRPIDRPAHLPAATETMWRSDRLYDGVVEVTYNVRPRVRGLGSAIFIHLARPGFQPTAGCIGLRESDLQKLVAMMGPRTRLVVGSLR